MGRRLRGVAFHVSSSSSYGKTYGVLGGVIVFLLWLWITNLAILLGAEFNAETERECELHPGAARAEDAIGLAHREAPNGIKQPAAR